MIINKEHQSLQHLTSTLKDARMRLTPQRIAICRMLNETRDHPTAAQIYESLKEAYPSLSLMTVYNTLNTLVRLGVVNELGSIGDDNAHYDGDTSPHVNMACVACHRISDTECTSAADLEREVSRESGFKILGSRMLFYGLCPDCQKSEKITSNH